MTNVVHGSKIVSFSIPPTKMEDREQVEKLQKHCKTSGINFSHMVVQGIKHMNKQLGLENDN